MDALNSLGWQIRDHLKQYRLKTFETLKHQHCGQSRRVIGGREDRPSRSRKTIFSKGA